MAEREEVGDRTIRVPEHMIETINRLVRTSRQMLTEIGREPTPEELAEKLAMPLEKVRKVLKISQATDHAGGADRRRGGSRSRLILRSNFTFHKRPSSGSCEIAVNSAPAGRGRWHQAFPLIRTRGRIAGSR